jgi:ABC-2 type transport system ATP-binding protein
MQENALELEGVTKLYKNGRGVEDISFTLAPGEILGLLGPNGSGKTTAMKAIAGLVRPQSGSIRVCGVDALVSHEEAMSHTGCLIEAPALYEHLTVEQNIKMAARFYKHVDNERIDKVLHMVGMDKYKKDKVRTLSLGMGQRVGLAMALLSEPNLLILDEPANGLDIEGMAFIRELIKNLAEGGMAVLISSHLANEIQQCATKIVVLYGGRLLGSASMETVLESFDTVENFFLDQVNKSRGGQTP